MTQLWAIQTKALNDYSIEMVSAFQYYGLNWAAFPLKPFSKTLPEFNWFDGPIVWYGTTNMVDALDGESKYTQMGDPNTSPISFWYDREKHQPTYYGKLYGEDWLNHGSTQTTINDFMKNENHPEYIFIRPNDGLKLFAGKIWDSVRFKEFVRIQQENNLLPPDSKIIVNEKRTIYSEYRTWICNKKVIACCGYKKDGRVLPFKDDSSEIISYAEKMSEKCSPSDVFILDVANTDKGLKVIEINCFHCAGFYDPNDINEVVCEVSNFVKTNEHKGFK